MRHLLKTRAIWALGALLPWVVVWLLLGVRFALLIGASPHPFLPGVSYTGVMLRAVASWALWALAAYLLAGVIFSLIILLGGLLIPGERPAILGFRPGLLIGLASLFCVHGLLFWQVPMALGMIQGLRWLPMGLVILLFLGTGGWFTRKVIGGPRSLRAWSRVALGLGFTCLILSTPHDVFRRFMPRGPVLSPDKPRLLLFSVDGLRQDCAEAALPSLKAPGNCQPIVAIPATRLTWHMLLGAPPESYMNSLVIPFRSEWTDPPKTRLLNEAADHGLSTGFIIDDPTTLSFGLSRDRFAEVIEPSGGWKHFFTVGMGTCWPIYSWMENYFSPVETTNPWSDIDTYLRDVERGLKYHDWLCTHTCQLHAPFFLQRHELQELRPWRWFWHGARNYIPYQAMNEAERDHFRRRDGRANPVNHYRIRVRYLLTHLDARMRQWAMEYPQLSGVLTADHGEEHAPVMDKAGNLVNFFTGMHGFSLEPSSVRVPLHGFGLTRTELGPENVFSWIDLRDCLDVWIADPTHPLILRSDPSSGWVIQFNTVQAVHVQRTETQKATASGTGVRPQDLMSKTYLTDMGIWFMDDLDPAIPNWILRKSYALVDGKGMITLNPVAADKYMMRRYDKAYAGLEQEVIMDQQAFKLLKAFPGKRLVPDVIVSTDTELQKSGDR